jgi:predicted RNA-binding protein
MPYFLDLFSPETYEAFSKSSRDISGFRIRQQNLAAKVKPGDKLICYMTKFSRWVGILEVINGPYQDDTPIFYPENDPFILRFKVKPNIWLSKEQSIPIHEEEIWNTLSFTRGQDKNSHMWTGKVRSSLNLLTEADGKFLEKILANQLKSGKEYEIDDEHYQKQIRHQVRRLDKIVTVSVPDDVENTEITKQAPGEVRESIKIQSLIAQIGAQMGMKIWLPKSDRMAVLKEWADKDNSLLEKLPLNYDETTLKTIEQIDVLWLKGRSIIRAFEVEHTTSIYSGILRMADLLALQPNMDIKLHIVAPYERKEKVFQEVKRPVFSLLERGPLAENCTYISYDSVKEISELKHLSHLSDTVLDEYTEEAE